MGVITFLLDRWKTLTKDLNKEMDEVMGEFEKHLNGDSKSAPEDSNVRAKSEETPKNSDECIDNGKTHKQGEQWTEPGECNLKICHRRGVISVRKCPEWQVEPPCSQEQLHNSNIFPECCPSAVCPTSNSTKEEPN